MFLHARRDVGIRCVGLLFKQSDDAHDHSGGAVTTLESAFGEECFLDWMQFVALGKALDGDNGFFVGVRDWGKAGSDALTIEENGAGAALAFAAPIFSAGELEVLAKDVEERAFRISGDGVGTAVDREFESRIHTRFEQ
jgi:hypothetical protein